MRKLQAGAVSAAEQTNARPASPEPRKEWPRWKRILAIAAVAGGALGLGACKPPERNDPAPRDPEMACLDKPSFSSEDFLSDPQQRESILRFFEENPLCVNYPGGYPFAPLATDENVDFPTRERIIRILERAGDYYYLAHIARVDSSSTNKIISILENAFISSTYEHGAGGVLGALESIAEDYDLEQHLKERILSLLEKAFVSNTNNSRELALDSLVSIARYGRPDPQLIEKVIGLFEDTEFSNPRIFRNAILDLTDITTVQQMNKRLRGRIVSILEKALQDHRSNGVAIIAECSLYHLCEIAMTNAADLQLKERIIDILERVWLSDTDAKLRDFAYELLTYYLSEDENTIPWLKTKLVGIFSKVLNEPDQNTDIRSAAAHGLAVIARAERTGPQLRGRIIRILERISHNSSGDVQSAASEALRWISAKNNGEYERYLFPSFGGGGLFGEYYPYEIFPSQVSPFGNPGR